MRYRGEEAYEPLIDPDEEQEVESSESSIASGVSRRVKMARQLLRYHNGGPDTFLTAEEELELAKTIQDGLVAEKHLAAASLEEQKRFKSQTAQLALAAEAGQTAQQKLFECNLRLAYYFVYKSMNIGFHDPNSEPPGTFGDIRKLRSPYASMEDRMQIALMGLARAVTKYRPLVTEPGKAPARFSTFAVWDIHSHLSWLTHDNEVAGLRLPTNQRDRLARASKDPSKFTAEELDSLAEYRSLTESIPFDELGLDATAPEEYEDDYNGIPTLRPDEVIADPDEDNDPVYGASYKLLQEDIKKVLATLSEREAGVIRLRFGLTDGEPRTLDEIAQVYGVTRDRIRQIESKTLGKLREAGRAQILRDYLDDEYLTHTRQVANNPYHLPELIPTVANVRTPQPMDYHRNAVFYRKEPAPQPAREPELESWQASPEDTWDMPVRQEAPVMSYEVKELEAEKLFNAMMKYIDPIDFKRSGTEAITYPNRTISDILENCGKHLLPQHIETYWNAELEKLVNRLRRANKREFNLDRVSLLFSALFDATMKDEDSVELNIPDKLNKKLNFFGSHLKQGRVVVNGDLGNFTGYSMQNIAELRIKGSVGDYTAAYSSGFASVKVDEDTGEALGHGVLDEVSFSVRGRVKSLALLPDFKGEIAIGGGVLKSTLGQKAISVDPEARH